MKKIYTRLFISVISIIGAVAMIIAVSYAWLTISESPEVNAINVAISGGNTIKLAPDMTKTIKNEDGTEEVVHFPGAFDEKLIFSQYNDSYGYLNSLSALTPVSTADGIHWFIPSYDAESGNIKSAEEFEIDSTLKYANAVSTEKGAYVYLDFWIVSPGFEYEVRVSMDKKSKDGSFLVELPKVKKTENGYTLTDTAGLIASSARVGFLVNEDGNSNSMEAYEESDAYDTRYKKLKGVYQEQGNESDGISQFTIYEPNALSHPNDSAKDGSYLITKPLAYDKYSMEISEADISERLMVQTNSSWKPFESEKLESGIQLEQALQAALVNKPDLSESDAQSYFYREHLQAQVGAYLNSGAFFSNTKELYESAKNNSTAEDLNDAKLSLAGAADDVSIIRLERNTPQRVRMYIWLEGQDADCTNNNSIEGTDFALSIELSGADK